MSATLTPDAPAKRPQGVTVLSPRELKIMRRTTVAFTVVPLVAVLVAVIGLWGWGISATDATIALAFYVFTGLGITVGFHRLFTHLSFDVPKPVRWGLAIAGSMAIQGSVIDWVAAHRRHHAYSDNPGDPHSPHLAEDGGVKGIIKGLWFAHVGWLTDVERTDNSRWAPDLLADPVVAKAHRMFPLLAISSFVLPAVIGGLVTWSVTGALTAFLWGGLVRIFVLHHVTWSINSICHFYGASPFESHDESRNNPVMALLAFGEGWHNNHHAFPNSARHGLRGWQFDSSWLFIRSLQMVKLARNVKVPTPSQLARRSTSP